MPLGSAINAAGGIISSILGNKAQKEANKANMQIAQMNNPWSEKMMEKQHAYDVQMWNMNNEYNSASAQRQRLEDAGLNPNLMMSGGSAGTASGGSSVSLPSPSNAQVQPLHFGGYVDAIKSSLEFALSTQKTQADIDFMRSQSDVMKAEAAQKIAESVERTRGAKYDTDFKQTMESTRASILNEDYLSRVQNREIGEMNKILMGQTRILNDIQITNLPQQMQADIALKLAQADSLTMPELAKELKFFEKRFGTKISKSDLKAIFGAWKQNIETQQYRGLNPFNFGIGILNRD